MRSFGCLKTIALVLLFPGSGEAASLRVAPTLIDMIAPDSAASLNLRNDDKRAINVQIRVFRWSQEEGEDKLEPTTDVVASPPTTSVAPGADYTVRIVRVSKKPVTAEDAYRLVVDELPDPTKRQAGRINLVLRYSIPVFVRSVEASAPAVSWLIKRSGDTLVLTARNAGERRLRIANLNLRNASGKTVPLRSGLVGYVLGGAQAQWSFKGAKTGALSERSVSVNAQSDSGPVDATASIQTGH